MRTHTGVLPRGHLSFFRRIMPPTDCIAFRARLDHEGTDLERAVLGTAGEEAVYIWDLDDEDYVERIDISPEQQRRIQVSCLRSMAFSELTSSTSNSTKTMCFCAQSSRCTSTRGKQRLEY